MHCPYEVVKRVLREFDALFVPLVGFSSVKDTFLAVTKRTRVPACITANTSRKLSLPECPAFLWGHLFKLFAGAESLAAASPEFLERVKEDKSFLLQTDLARHNPVLGTVDDMKTFKERLGEYTTHVMTKRTNGLFAYKLRKGSNSARSWYWRVARLKIAAKNVKEDPVLKQLMEDSFRKQANELLSELESKPVSSEVKALLDKAKKLIEANEFEGAVGILDAAKSKQ